MRVRLFYSTTDKFIKIILPPAYSFSADRDWDIIIPGRGSNDLFDWGDKNFERTKLMYRNKNSGVIYDITEDELALLILQYS